MWFIVIETWASQAIYSGGGVPWHKNEYQYIAAKMI
jgi:hypothetical protein